MKTLCTMLLLAIALSAYARVGSSKDDYLIIIVPAAFIAIIGIVYLGKSQYKVWKSRRTTASAPDTSGPQEPI